MNGCGGLGKVCVAHIFIYDNTKVLNLLLKALQQQHLMMPRMQAGMMQGMQTSVMPGMQTGMMPGMLAGMMQGMQMPGMMPPGMQTGMGMMPMITLIPECNIQSCLLLPSIRPFPHLPLTIRIIPCPLLQLHSRTRPMQRAVSAG
jgi:hypothetical protein